MNANNFVDSIRKSVIDENLELYKELFNNTSVETATDMYWKKILSIFHSLTPHQQQIFFEFCRQITVDTTSNILAVLDGTSSIEGFDEDFKLTYGAGGSKLNGELQDIFLTKEEENSNG
jgi:hypothetical protein